jgi:hypothetical protein
MWIAHVICSGQECVEQLEIVVDTLDELERLNCECGYGFEVLSIAEAELDQVTMAEVVPIGREHSHGERRAA